MPTLFLMPDQTMTIYSGFNPTDFNQYIAEITNFANYAPNVASYSEVGCSDFYIPDALSRIEAIMSVPRSPPFLLGRVCYPCKGNIGDHPSQSNSAPLPQPIH